MQNEELLSLDYQAQWFDGLIDEMGVEASKKPALGLVWTNLITSRIMLVRNTNTQTRMKVVFSPFAKPASLQYGISSEKGIHAIDRSERKASAAEGFETEEFRFEDFSDADVVELLSGQPDT